MATRINPVAGRYFNSPQFASAMSNLAGAFAPPSAQEYLIGQQVQAARAENERLSTLWDQAGGDFDRRGVVAGLYNPNQSYYAVDTAAETSRSNNAADNARALEVATMQDATTRRGDTLDLVQDYVTTPLTVEQGIPGLPDSVATELGIPALPSVGGSDVGALEGPLSETEMKAAIIADMSPEEQQAIAMSSVPVEQIVTPDGPRFATRNDAVGQEPFVNPGSPPKPEVLTYRTPDGQTGTATLAKGQLVDIATSQPLPQGTVTGKIEDTTDGFGATNSNQTDYFRVQQTVSQSDMLIDQLRGLVQQNAGAAGFAGSLQMLGQDFLQVGRELSEAFQLQPADTVTPDMLNAIGGSGDYNPVFRQIRSGMLQLAYLNAQRDNPRGEVSRFALERQIEALGQGVLGNDESVLAALSMASDGNQRALAAAEALRGQTAPASPAQPDIPTIATPEEAMRLPSGTQFYDPDGILRQVP